MEETSYVSIPKELADKIKSLGTEEEQIEKEVLCYIERTKKDISSQVENLDDDVLMFKAKLTSYKKAFKEAYLSADEEMYSFWEELDKKNSQRHKSLRNRFDGISNILNNEFEQKKYQIESLSKKMESINTYSFDRIISFLKSFESLSSESRELFTKLIGGEDGKEK